MTKGLAEAYPDLKIEEDDHKNIHCENNPRTEKVKLLTDTDKFLFEARISLRAWLKNGYSLVMQVCGSILDYSGLSSHEPT